MTWLASAFNCGIEQKTLAVILMQLAGLMIYFAADQIWLRMWKFTFPDNFLGLQMADWTSEQDDLDILPSNMTHKHESTTFFAFTAPYLFGFLFNWLLNCWTKAPMSGAPEPPAVRSWNRRFASSASSSATRCLNASRCATPLTAANVDNDRTKELFKNNQRIMERILHQNGSILPCNVFCWWRLLSRLV